jgi:flavorubredoxin
MNTTTTEIADNIFRLSTFVPDAGMSFNQILVNADEPLLFHTGMRSLFPLVSDAVSRVLPLTSLRWISFGHVEADECGSLNEWLGVAGDAQVAMGGLGCMVSVNDLADRPPHALDDGDVIDLGGKRVRYLATPHVPHGWEAGVFFEETTSTLLCGDLFTQLGDEPAIRHDSPMEPASVAEDMFGYSTLAPSSAQTVERLADLAPTTLALMHGPACVGDAGQWLRDLASNYRHRVDVTLAQSGGSAR